MATHAGGGGALDCGLVPAGYRARASILIFDHPTCAAVLLVSSSSRPGAWVVPGGGIEPGETPLACALRELWEEAGAVPCSRQTGGQQEGSGGGGGGGAAAAALQLRATPLITKRSATFPFACRLGRLEEVYPESSQRQRRWWPLAEAQGALEGSTVGLAVWAAAMEALGAPGALPTAADIMAHLRAAEGP